MEDRISAGILKAFWVCGRLRLVGLVGGCIRLGYHPDLWKTARGIVIPKPDYSQVRAYRIVSLLDVISNLVERTTAHLISEQLERGGTGSDAIAVLTNRTERVWRRKRAAGAVLMDAKAASTTSAEHYWRGG